MVRRSVLAWREFKRLFLSSNFPPNITWHTTELEEDAGERSFDNAIPWRQIGEAAYDPYIDEFNQMALNLAIDKHLARTKTNPDFEYVLGVNDINRSNREMTSITLSEKARRENRRKRDLERLALENKRRIALGQPEYDSVEMLDQEQNGDESESSAAPDDEPDPFLLEGGRILTDFSYFALLHKDGEDSTTLVDKQQESDNQLLSN